jgi:hypothetical protein
MAQRRGIRVSKQNKNVLTCGYNDLIFTSEFPALKIHAQGSGEVTFTGHGGTATDTVIIPHNVGISPMFFAFTEWYEHIGALVQEKQEGYKMFSFGISAGEFTVSKYLAFTDPTALYLDYSVLNVAEDPFSLKYIYYIFEDPVLE